MIVAWLSPHRFPAWREVYRRTAATADVLIVRVQSENPLGLTLDNLDDGDPLFLGKQVMPFESRSRWNSSNWRQEFCETTYEYLEHTRTPGPHTILQFDEDEALPSTAVANDLRAIEDGHKSVWYRFHGPLPSVDRFFDGRVSELVKYPAAPHCKIWRWFPSASFTKPKYQGYASPCGIPMQPDRTFHVLSPNRIMHLLLATPELRAGRRDLLEKYLRRGRCLKQLDAALAVSREPQDFNAWLTTIVGD